MKHRLLTTIAAVVMVGGAGVQQSTPPEEVNPAESVAEVQVKQFTPSPNKSKDEQ